MRFASREGSTILGAAVIDDVMGIIVLSVVVAGGRASAGGVDLSQIVIVAVRMAAFFVVAVMAGRWLLPHLFRWASALGVGQAVLAGCRCSGLSFIAWTADYLGGVAAITGAYIAG